MTLTEDVLRLARAGARIDSGDTGVGMSAGLEDLAPPAAEPMAHAADRVDRAPSEAREDDAGAGSSAAFEPGLQDLEAAVALVAAGLATRVVLAGFPSWPGLLWRAYQLADTSDVLILPTVVRPGGKVDIVITGNAPANG